MNKLILCGLTFFPFWAMANPLVVADKFEIIKCQNGTAGYWDGACKCPDIAHYDGRYCKKKVLIQCQTNQDCQDGEYCLVGKNEGACHTLQVYTPINYNGATYYISAEMSNHASVRNFCAALDAEPLQRSDWGCVGMGPGCLDNDTVIYIQDNFPNLGFYWLEKEDDNTFYYFDVNDGTVYSVPQDSISHMQPICVKKEK